MLAINLTPHVINVQVASGEIVDIQPSGDVARVSVDRKVSGDVDIAGTKVPTTVAVYGEVEGLPVAHRGFILIVSGLVKAQVPARTDVFSPGPLVRDENGRPCGCRGLSA